MSTTVPVPTRDCVGIDVTKNGQVVASYDAHNGVVDVDNRSHRRLLERTFGSKRQIALGSGAPEMDRCACGRAKFVSQEICGGCYLLTIQAEVLNVPASS